ncbi:MAG: tyrosine-type recombinase/integrase [Candidatus Kapabacteria bacterium]|nr:tyrosine-type recombinase/integrase [Candidatus Kapabacteria bacterium]
MNINFYLERPNKKELCLVYVFVRGLDPSNHRNAIKIKTYVEIPASAWNSNKQQIRSSFKDYQFHNSILEDYKLRTIETINTFKDENPFIEFTNLRDKVKQIVQKNETVFKKIIPEDVKISRDFFDVLDLYIKSKGDVVGKTTIKRYVVIKNHLIKFANSNKLNLTIDSFTNEISDKLIKYFLKEKHLNNTISRSLKQIKTLLIWANKRGYKVEINDEAFRFLKYDSDIIYLTDNEIKLIEDIDLSERPALDKIKDLFIFQLHTGQRFGDVQSLKFDQVVDYYWNMRTEKTQVVNKIPLSNRALNIIEKYKSLNQLPRISSQKMNENIKEICKLAGIDTLVTITSYRGSQKIVEVKPKYLLISSHNAKKSFVTKAINSGIDLSTVMNLTGNKDPKTLKRYYEIMDKTKKSAIAEMFN